MKKASLLLLGLLPFLLSFSLVGCGPTVNQIKPQEPVSINKTFQRSLTPMPGVPQYRCGAWASTSAPGAYSSITVYAKITKDVTGVPGAMAQAIVHFKSSDVTLDARPVSDAGGYVTFALPLQGRQPRLSAATVDINFSVQGQTVHCSQAFFTPQ
jgi:ABC-type amino acid transport substrate-binding protein